VENRADVDVAEAAKDLGASGARGAVPRDRRRTGRGWSGREPASATIRASAPPARGGPSIGRFRRLYRYHGCRGGSGTFPGSASWRFHWRRRRRLRVPASPSGTRAGTVPRGPPGPQRFVRLDDPAELLGADVLAARRPPMRCPIAFSTSRRRRHAVIRWMPRCPAVWRPSAADALSPARHRARHQHLLREGQQDVTLACVGEPSAVRPVEGLGALRAPTACRRTCGSAGAGARCHCIPIAPRSRCRILGRAVRCRRSPGGLPRLPAWEHRVRPPTARPISANASAWRGRASASWTSRRSWLNDVPSSASMTRPNSDGRVNASRALEVAPIPRSADEGHRPTGYADIAYIYLHSRTFKETVSFLHASIFSIPL